MSALKPAKHGRDHEPGGEDPIRLPGRERPFAYMYWDTGENRASGVWGRPTPWTNGYANEAALVRQVGSADPLLQVVLSGGSGPRIKVNHGNGPFGLYKVRGVASWQTSGAPGAFSVGLEIAAANNYGAEPLAQPVQDFEDANVLLTNSSNGLHSKTEEFLLYTTGANNFSASVWHNKGSNWWLNYMLLEVTRVEIYEVGGGNGVFYP